MKFTRNADLVIKADKDFKPSQTGQAGNVDLKAFTGAGDMVQWEMAAYTSYGLARCEAEKIDTLADLFGRDFNAAFRKRHRLLLAVLEVADLESQRNDLNSRIDELNRLIANGDS